MTVRVDWRASVGFVGRVLKWLAVPLLFPLGIAALYGESVTPFLVTIAVTVALGLGMEFLDTGEGDLGVSEAFLMVALTWLGIALVGAVPFVVAGQGSLASPVNAFFESMSGITTTGATTILDFDAHSRAIMMWRSLLQWLGGLGILVLVISVLSNLSVAGAQLMETETQTTQVRKLTPRIRETAQLLWKLFIGLTLLQAGLLYFYHVVGVAPEMTLYDAVAHAFTTIATAGFSPRARSIEAFAPIVQWTVVPFMAVGATNFILLYYVTKGRLRRPLESEEFRFYVGVLGFFTMVTAALLFLDAEYNAGVEETLRHAAFQVVSIVTTTGYASTDFNLWSEPAKHILFLCMFIGGMAGSTTCSIKTLRWLMVLKGFRRDLFTAFHPDAVRPIRLSGEVVDEVTVKDIYAYVLTSLVIFFLATIYVVVDSARFGGVGEFDAMGAAASTFLNIGPAFGPAGPFGSYEGFPDTTKLVMVFLMWMGRIEIIPVLVLFTPSFWRS